MNTKILLPFLLFSLLAVSCNSATSGSDAGPDTGTAAQDALSSDSASPSVDTGPSQPPVDGAGGKADASGTDGPGPGSGADAADAGGPGDGAGADVASGGIDVAPGSSACGVAVCPPNTVCCNPVRGTCVQPGGICTQ